MNATKTLPKTIAQQMAARAEAIRIAEPYMRQMYYLLSMTVPTMTMTRHEGHVSIETSYPPEIQGAVDRIQAMCRESIRQYLDREGFVYGSVYGGEVQLPPGHDSYG